MPPRPYILAETNWKAVQATKFEVAVLPWGATEAHNYHLPYATDNIQAEYIAAESARIAWEKGERVVVLPCIPFGVQTGQFDIPLSINMYPSTQAILLHDIVESLSKQGIPKLVVLNGHGGNDFKQMLRELQAKFPSVFLTTLHWFRVLKSEEYFTEPGDHAGELETSLVQHISPDLVLSLDQAGDGGTHAVKLTAHREGWAWAQREWTKATRDTGDGDPRLASAEKGEAFLQALCEKIAGYFVELAKCDPSDLYEVS